MQSEKLKEARDLLLKLHKSLVDHEKASYIAFYGNVSPAQFLTQLLENPDLAWLRRFSTLIVDIDEMFAQKDGFSDEAVVVHWETMRGLVSMESLDVGFRSRYELALQGDINAASLQAELKSLLST